MSNRERITVVGAEIYCTCTKLQNYIFFTQIIEFHITTMSKHKTVVHWFRKGLRIHDNPALLQAISIAEKENYKLRPVFFLDPSIRKW